MKIQEAIRILKMEMLGDSEQMEYAKQIAIEALEKQIPKKPKSYLVNMKHIDFLCPNCKKRIISKVDGEWLAGKNQKFCDECGQSLDFGDLNGIY